jgi:SAM-dependent methyltransferase
VVERAALTPGERVLDVACGTGNAALLAAAAGAAVTGLDAAPRLVEVARGRAAAAGVDATFVVGDAVELPFDDGAFDVVISVFGIIFAPDAEKALEEVFRVLRPGGRALVAAWVPEGAIHEMVGALARGVRAAGGPERPRFPWHDPAGIAPIAARHGATVDAEPASLVVTGSSPEAYFADGEEHHPMSVAMRPLLERTGRYTDMREEAIAALRAGNEDATAFRVTSPYRIMRLTLEP